MVAGAMVMGFAACKYAQGVGQQVQHGLQRRNSTAWTAGQVQHKGLPAGAADAAAESSERRLSQAGGTHLFGDAVEQTVADGACGFRGNIARCDPGPAGGDDQPCDLRVLAESFLEQRLLVGNQNNGIDGETCVGKEAGDGGPGEVVALAGRAGVADSDDNGAGHAIDCRRATHWHCRQAGLLIHPQLDAGSDPNG